MEKIKHNKIYRDNIHSINACFIKKKFGKIIIDNLEFYDGLYKYIKSNIGHLIVNCVEEKGNNQVSKYINDNNIDTTKYFYKECSKRIIHEMAQEYGCFELKLSKVNIANFSIIIYHLVGKYVN